MLIKPLTETKGPGGIKGGYTCKTHRGSPSLQEVSMVCTVSSTTSRSRGVTALVRIAVVPRLYLQLPALLVSHTHGEKHVYYSFHTQQYQPALKDSFGSFIDPFLHPPAKLTELLMKVYYRQKQTMLVFISQHSETNQQLLLLGYRKQLQFVGQIQCVRTCRCAWKSGSDQCYGNCQVIMRSP